MLETNKYSVINILRYLNSTNPKRGENRLSQVLSELSLKKVDYLKKALIYRP